MLNSNARNLKKDTDTESVRACSVDIYNDDDIKGMPKFKGVTKVVAF